MISNSAGDSFDHYYRGGYWYPKYPRFTANPYYEPCPACGYCPCCGRRIGYPLKITFYDGAAGTTTSNTGPMRESVCSCEK